MAVDDKPKQKENVLGGAVIDCRTWQAAAASQPVASVFGGQRRWHRQLSPFLADSGGGAARTAIFHLKCL